MERRFLICGNWKCNGSTQGVNQIIDMLKDAQIPPTTDVIVCPPFVYLPLVHSKLRRDVQIAAQNCWTQSGDFTGEVSVEMLLDLDFHWVVLGQSERRIVFGETNEIVGSKIGSALSKGLNTVVCVGENLEQRNNGDTSSTLRVQLEAIPDNISSWNNIIIAYEPVWTFGTGRVATPANVIDAHSIIRMWFRSHVSEPVAQSMIIIYGGSVDGGNCRELAALSDVDGFLIGPSSSMKAEFVDIIKSSTTKSFAQLHKGSGSSST